MYENIPSIPTPSPVAVLPTGASLNPAHPDVAKHPYHDSRTVVYVLFKMDDTRTRPTRVLTSFGAIKEWRLGTILHLVHDQTGSRLGRYKIVGVKDFNTNEEAGDIPDIAIKHSVLK